MNSLADPIAKHRAKQAQYQATYRKRHADYREKHRKFMRKWRLKRRIKDAKSLIKIVPLSWELVKKITEMERQLEELS